jgi:tetratricopeptide (TPR) repeat protein
MLRCPVCKSELPNLSINHCNTCNWEITKEPFQQGDVIPLEFQERTEKIFDWMRKLWQKHQHWQSISTEAENYLKVGRHEAAAECYQKLFNFSREMGKQSQHSQISGNLAAKIDCLICLTPKISSQEENCLICGYTQVPLPNVLGPIPTAYLNWEEATISWARKIWQNTNQQNIEAYALEGFGKLGDIYWKRGEYKLSIQYHDLSFSV